MARYNEKLTPELQAKFCEALENGSSILGACGYVGIDEKTYYNWINKAKEAKTRTKYVKFKECVDNAKNKALHNFEQVIVSASMEHWQAAAWMLERRHSDIYAKKDKLEADLNGNIKSENLNIEVKSTEEVLKENEDSISRFISRRLKETD